MVGLGNLSALEGEYLTLDRGGSGDRCAPAARVLPSRRSEYGLRDPAGAPGPSHSQKEIDIIGFAYARAWLAPWGSPHRRHAGQRRGSTGDFGSFRDM
jgi:hypothetical protein